MTDVRYAEPCQDGEHGAPQRDVDRAPREHRCKVSVDVRRWKPAPMNSIGRSGESPAPVPADVTDRINRILLMYPRKGNGACAESYCVRGHPAWTNSHAAHPRMQHFGNHPQPRQQHEYDKRRSHARSLPNPDTEASIRVGARTLTRHPTDSVAIDRHPKLRRARVQSTDHSSAPKAGAAGNAVRLGPLSPPLGAGVRCAGFQGLAPLATGAGAASRLEAGAKD